MILQKSKAFNVLERSLDAATLRQKVIANNIANVDTPFFKRSVVQFEDLLQSEMDGSSSSSFSGRRMSLTALSTESSTPQWRRWALR